MKKKASSETDETKSKEGKKTEEASKTESHFLLGNKLFYEDHDYEGAISEYKQATKEEKDETIKLKSQYLMAESFVKIGKIDEAVGIFKTLAEKHKDHYLGDSARRRIEGLKDYIVPNM